VSYAEISLFTYMHTIGHVAIGSNQAPTRDTPIVRIILHLDMSDTDDIDLVDPSKLPVSERCEWPTYV
jgi:hypothetical protein